MKKISVVTFVFFVVGVTSGTLVVYSYLIMHDIGNPLSDLYSYSDYAQMTIVRLDRTVLQQTVNFVDLSNNITIIPKLQESIDQVGNKYHIMLEKCSNNTKIDGYCNDLPIDAEFTTNITSDEFRTLDNTLQLKPLGISVNGTWFSNIKYRHDGCFPLAHGYQLDQSKSDDYCYYKIVIEKR
ncbi:MAG: hypothetical protein LV477_00295 [Candidatus Nitrosotalea sp.]|nr:hypothetical protein [Candidatus Nitrosotalea sp.]